MLYMIFQSDLEPVLIQRIVIGFEAILEKLLPIAMNSLVYQLILKQNRDYAFVRPVLVDFVIPNFVMYSD